MSAFATGGWVHTNSILPPEDFYDDEEEDFSDDDYHSSLLIPFNWSIVWDRLTTPQKIIVAKFAIAVEEAKEVKWT